jgi:HAMP domain-containing protein
MAAVIIAGLIGAALVVVASWALSRDIARPITALENAARRLRAARPPKWTCAPATRSAGCPTAST